MRRKWIGGLAAAAALAAATLAASSVFGADEGPGPRPAYATVSIDLSDAAPAAARSAARPKPKTPKLVYLDSPAPVMINPSPPPTGVGQSVDVKLTGCSKVIEGGVVANSPDVFLQGSYIASNKEYHVLIGVLPTDLAPFTITSHLTCLKKVK